jgi:hypothetical protein
MNKQYTDNAKKGIQGEAFFEFIIAKYSIPHKIDRSKDLGIDFLCEWVNDNKPTGVVFSAQVKYYPSRLATKVGKEIKLNLLDKYKLEPSISVDSRTQEYWKLLGMPCYLFIVIQKGNSIDLFYKRYTPIINGKGTEERSAFYKVNDELIFLAFAKGDIGGFARDLYIDQIRANYNKGLIAYLNPRRLGLGQFPNVDKDVYFKDLFKEYKANFEDAFEQLNLVLNKNSKLEAIPSLPPGKNDI